MTQRNQNRTHTVKTQNFSENEDKNHADEEPGLLSRAAHTGVTDYADCKPGCETSETDGEAGAELGEALREGHVGVN